LHHHKLLQLGVFVVIEIGWARALEVCRLDKGEHDSEYAAGVHIVKLNASGKIVTRPYDSV